MAGFGAAAFPRRLGLHFLFLRAGHEAGAHNQQSGPLASRDAVEIGRRPASAIAIRLDPSRVPRS